MVIDLAAKELSLYHVVPLPRLVDIITDLQDLVIRRLLISKQTLLRTSPTNLYDLEMYTCKDDLVINQTYLRLHQGQYFHPRHFFSHGFQSLACRALLSACIFPIGHFAPSCGQVFLTHSA